MRTTNRWWIAGVIAGLLSAIPGAAHAQFQGFFPWYVEHQEVITQGYTGASHIDKKIDHLALDWGEAGNPDGLRIISIKSAEVVVSECQTNGAGEYINYGCHVILKHGDGTKSHYTHLRPRWRLKAKGVCRGEKVGNLGKTGNTGNPKKNHLHFQMWDSNGTRMKPQQLYGKNPVGGATGLQPPTGDFAWQQQWISLTTLACGQSSDIIPD